MIPRAVGFLSRVSLGTDCHLSGYLRDHAGQGEWPSIDIGV